MTRPGISSATGFRPGRFPGLGLGLGLGGRVPDARAVWRYREALAQAQAGMVDALLFARSGGYRARQGNVNPAGRSNIRRCSVTDPKGQTVDIRQAGQGPTATDPGRRDRTGSHLRRRCPRRRRHQSRSACRIPVALCCGPFPDGSLGPPAPGAHRGDHQARAATGEPWLEWPSISASSSAIGAPPAMRLRIPRKMGIYSTRSWALVPRHRGQPFHGIVGS